MLFLGKELFVRFTVRVFRKVYKSVCVLLSHRVGCGIWLNVLILDYYHYCLNYGRFPAARLRR